MAKFWIGFVGFAISLLAAGLPSVPRAQLAPDNEPSGNSTVQHPQLDYHQGCGRPILDGLSTAAWRQWLKRGLVIVDQEMLERAGGPQKIAQFLHSIKRLDRHTGCLGRFDVELRDLDIHQDLNLAGVSLPGDLTIVDTTIVYDSDTQAIMRLEGLTLGGNLSISSSELDVVWLQGADISGDMVLMDVETSYAFNLEAARIGGNVWLGPGVRMKQFRARFLDVGGNLRLSPTLRQTTCEEMAEPDFGARRPSIEFLEVPYARIGGSFIAENADLGIAESKFFDAVLLADTRVGRQFIILHSNIVGRANFNFMHVESDAFMSRTMFAEGVLFTGVSLRSLYLAGVHLSEMSLAGAKMSGGLLFMSLPFCSEHSIAETAEMTWLGKSTLSLRNAEAAAFDGAPGSHTVNANGERMWPTEIDLRGFEYADVGGPDGLEGVGMSAMSAEAWRDWLALSPFDTQPYSRLAAHFEAAGRPEDARAIRFAARAREHKILIDRFVSGADRSPCAMLELIWLSVEHVLIGYGFYSFRAIFALLFIIVIGAFVFSHAVNRGYAIMPSNVSPPHPVLFSLHSIIPFVSLHGDMDDISLRARALWSFTVLKILGFVCASFFVAGLSGLVN